MTNEVSEEAKKAALFFVRSQRMMSATRRGCQLRRV
jgi:hypothetical protein